MRDPTSNDHSSLFPQDALASVEWTDSGSLTRPAPAERVDVRRHLTAVVHAVGVNRIVTGVLGAVVVVAAGWWLLRPPPLPIEDTLPMATPGSSIGSDAAADGSSGSVRAEEAPGEAGDLFVHVAGAVRRPGVYRVAAGDRVADAVERAGGATGRADLDRVNLAALLVDGQQILVPREGEPSPAPTADPAADGFVGPIDLNTADIAALDALPGVGPTTAAAIIAHRDEQGPFASVEDLLEVPGIGPAKLAALRDLVTT